MIRYIKGDLFDHLKREDNIHICHIVNNQGRWGAGFTKALDKYSKIPKETYLEWYRSTGNFSLGEICFACTDNIDNIEVIHMLAQNGLPGKYNPKPVVYSALVDCMREVVFHTDKLSKIYCPKIGTGYGGGDWMVISALMEEIWQDRDVTVFEL